MWFLSELVLQFLWNAWTCAIYGEGMEMEDMTVVFYRAPGKLPGSLLGFLPPRLIPITLPLGSAMEEGTGIIL